MAVCYVPINHDLCLLDIQDIKQIQCKHDIFGPAPGGTQQADIHNLNLHLPYRTFAYIC